MIPGKHSNLELIWIQKYHGIFVRDFFRDLGQAYIEDFQE